jgi:hypothetical protein
MGIRLHPRRQIIVAISLQGRRKLGVGAVRRTSGRSYRRLNPARGGTYTVVEQYFGKTFNINYTTMKTSIKAPILPTWKHIGFVTLISALAASVLVALQ